MHKSHQIKLHPTKKQKLFFKKSCGVARFAYNWSLNRWNEKYKNGEKCSAYTLIKELNSIKKQQFLWMQETGKCASQYAIHDLEAAFKSFFKKKSKYPRFKKKGVHDSFVSVENTVSFEIKNNKIWIPRLGYVKCCEELRFENSKPLSVTIKRIADMWFAVINVEIESPTKAPIVSENQATIGVDVGIKTMLILSDGTTFESPKALKSNSKSLKHLQRGLSRKQKGSVNRRKQQMRVAKKYYRISCIRKNAIHQATTFIVKKYDKIVIENLNVKGMVKNHNLAKVLSDVSFGEIARQLTYKAQWAGKELIKSDSFFASSKTCSNCGNKKSTLLLSERIYECEKCGIKIDRDLNAAKNLPTYCPTLKPSESEAFGGTNSAIEKSFRVSKKKEIVLCDKNKLIN